MADEQLRLSEWFPLQPKACKEPAKAFFDCFATASVSEDNKVCPPHRLKEGTLSFR